MGKIMTKGIRDIVLRKLKKCKKDFIDWIELKV